MIASPTKSSRGSSWICAPPRTLCSGASTWLPACRRMCTPRTICPAPPGASCSLRTSIANWRSFVKPAGVRIAKFRASSSRLMSTILSNVAAMALPRGTLLTPHASTTGAHSGTAAAGFACHEIHAQHGTKAAARLPPPQAPLRRHNLYMRPDLVGDRFYTLRHVSSWEHSLFQRYYDDYQCGRTRGSGSTFVAREYRLLISSQSSRGEVQAVYHALPRAQRLL